MFAFDLEAMMMSTTVQERVTRAMHQLALIAAAARDGASDEHTVMPNEVMAGIVFAAEEAHGELYWISRNAGRALQAAAPTDDDIEANQAARGQRRRP